MPEVTETHVELAYRALFATAYDLGRQAIAISPGAYDDVRDRLIKLYSKESPRENEMIIEAFSQGFFSGSAIDSEGNPTNVHKANIPIITSFKKHRAQKEERQEYTQAH